VPTIEDIVLAYVAAWNEHDPARCRDHVANCWAVDATAIGTTSVLVGREALVADIERFHREMPGYRGVLTSGLDAHHNVVRFAVTLLDAAGARVADAIDVGTTGPDGLLVQIITFWGPLPPVPGTWPNRLIIR
jgi:hypothetical protein